MNTVLKYIIVEDQKLEELHLYSLLLKYKSLELVGRAASVPAAISLIETQMPDIIFMDVKIEGGNGVEIARLLKEKIKIVIFVSSYAEYAIEGFEIFALDFLLKPVKAERLEITYQRIMEYWSLKELEKARMLYALKDMIVIKSGDKEIMLKAQEISFLEAFQDYTKVVTTSDKYLVNASLTKFLEQQVPGVFIQIHRSYAVVKKSIKSVKDNKLICDNCVLPIGLTYIDEMNKYKT